MAEGGYKYRGAEREEVVDKVAKLPKKWELLWKPAERRNKREITLKKKIKKKITKQKLKPTVSASPPKCTCPGILFCNVDKIFHVKKVFILFFLPVCTN